MKATLQTVTILLGAAIAVAARVMGKPVLFWPAMGLLLMGFSIRFIRGVR